MSPHGIAFLASLVVVILLIPFVYRLLRANLRSLLQDTTGLPAATEFYLRSFAIVIVLATIGAVLGTSHNDLKDGAHFMEYVWSVASGFEDAFQQLMIVLFVYIGLITVLMASLRRKQ